MSTAPQGPDSHLRIAAATGFDCVPQEWPGPPVRPATGSALTAVPVVGKMAERAGFEPAMGCPIPHFQCGALGH